MPCFPVRVQGATVDLVWLSVALLIVSPCSSIIIQDGDITVPGTKASFPITSLGTFSYWSNQGLAKVRVKGRPTILPDQGGLLLSDAQLLNVSLLVATSEDILGLLNPDYLHHADEDPADPSPAGSAGTEASALVCQRAKHLHQFAHHAPVPLQPQRLSMTLTSPGTGIQTLWALNCLWPSQDIGLQVSLCSIV